MSPPAEPSPAEPAAGSSARKPKWPRRQNAAAWMTLLFVFLVLPAWAGYRHTYENLGSATRDTKVFGMLGYYVTMVEQPVATADPPIRTWRIPPAALIATLGWTAGAALSAGLGFLFLGRRKDSGAWCDVCLQDLVGVESPNCPECGAVRKVSG